jgi:transcriptional regulator with XRE-family HTH domain
MRDERGWSQQRAAQEVGKTQSIISRLESPAYGKMSLQTLLDVANGFDVGLLIKFVPFSRLVQEYEDVSAKALSAQSVSEQDEAERLATVLSTPVWYQGSYARATYVVPHTNFDIDISQTGNAEDFSRAVRVLTDRWSSNIVTYVLGAGASLTNALQESNPLDEMPILDYTGESEQASIQTDTREVYKFTPSIFLQSGIYVRVDS